MYYGYSTPYKSPAADGSLWEKLFFPTKRARHLILIATVCTFSTMVILNYSVTSLPTFSYDLASLSDQFARLKPYANHEYGNYRSCNHCSTFNITFAITNQDFCSTTDDIYLLILVLSHPNNIERRNAIRNTWGAVSEHEGKSIKTVFLLGLNEAEKALYAGVPNKPYVDIKVEAESRTYKDLIVINMADHYTWLTNKSIAGLSWASSYCNRAQFLLKTDDDCYNNPNRYINFLSSSWLPPGFIGGCCFTGLPDRNHDSKWYTDPVDFSDMYFPVYCGGPAYIMPLRTTNNILNAAVNVPYFTMEDIFITGFCREAARIPYIQIPGVNAPRDVEDCDLALWVTHVHRVNAKDQEHMWLAAQDKESCYTPGTGLVTVLCMLLFIGFWAYVLSRVLGSTNKINIKSYYYLVAFLCSQIC